MKRHSNTARLSLLTALVMALVTGLVILALNIVFTRYIDAAAHEAISREARAFLSPDAEEPAPGRAPIQVNTLFAREDFTPDEAYLPLYPLSALERALLRDAGEQGGFDAVRRVSLLGEELYVQALLLEASQDAPAMAAVLYANVSPLKAFLRLLNTVFLAVLLAAGAVAVLLGLRLGRRIDNSQWKLQRFFANASHELKTPLTIIQGYAEGIAHGLAPDNQKAADSILSASDRMARLVDELLFLSRVDSGALQLQKEPFSIQAMLENCAQELEPLAAQRKLRLATSIPEDLPEFRGDAANLERAVRNVLNNAIRYAEKQVTLFAYVLGGNLVIKVKDDGQGISKKDLPNIFDRFYAGAAGQTGVGLSLAREIAQLHGGSLDAENNNGAQFRFTLPLG